MSEDKKIVTKKTAPKPAATTKKTATKGSEGQEIDTEARTASPQKTPVAAGGTVKKRSATTKAQDASAAAKKTTTKKAAPPPETRLEEKPVTLKQLAQVSPEQRQKMIEEAAFYKAEKRNFAPGHETQDWADAEREIDELLARAKVIYGA